MAENTTIKPWHDCPRCPACNLPCGVQATGGGPHLHCPACGHRWHGTDAEREQARRADEAWKDVESTECWGAVFSSQ